MAISIFSSFLASWLKALSSELRCWPCLSSADPCSPLLAGLAIAQGWAVLLGTHHPTTSQNTV